MKSAHKTTLALSLITSTLVVAHVEAAALGTAFTYQGRLTEGGSPATGLYDLRFVVYDALTNGSAVTGVLTNAGSPVSNGLFAATLDFGAVFDGSARWLEIAVRTNGSADAFTVLRPRTKLTPTPHALYAVKAGMLPENVNQTFAGTVLFSPGQDVSPFQVASVTRVPNLNADLLDGKDASDFLLRTQQCVKSIAELKATSPGFVDSVSVLGYYSPGDGGAGIFYWDAAATEADNQGTVIEPVPPASGRWKRMAAGPLSVKWFGAKGDAKTDDTEAIQAAEDAAANVGGVVRFPPGTYLINGARAAIPGDTRRYGINKKSNTKWVGDGYGSSILRLKADSTAQGVDPQMVYANAPLTDVGFYRLGFDLNGASNTLGSLANVAAIWFNGEALEVHGMAVDSCRFYNGPGATVILVQNRATSWSGHETEYPLEDVLILNNRFEDNCLSPATTDHSTMNIWARHTRVIGNSFQETAAVPNLQRYYYASAIEFHGGDGLFLGNTIRSYGSVVIPSENFIEPWENLLIANNVVSDLGLYFVDTAVGSSLETKPIDKIVVRGNHVVFNNDTSGGWKAGLIQAHSKPISYIEVSDNYFEMASPSPVIWPVGVVSQAGTPTSHTTHLKVTGNTFNKMQFAVWVDNYNHFDQVKNCEFVNNTCLNMQDLSSAPEAAGLWADGAVSQHIENLVVAGNRFINEANHAGYMYGIELRSFIDNLYLGADNIFYNLKSQRVWEVSLIFNWRGPVIEASSAWDPENVSAGSLVSTDVPVVGAVLGDVASASFSLDVQNLVLAAAVTATNTVTVTLQNHTTGAVNLNQGTLFIRVTKKAVALVGLRRDTSR